MDDETGWQKQVLVGVVVLVAVGALVGGIVALVSIKAADLAGIGGTGPTSVAKPQVNSGSSGATSTTTPTTPSETPPTTSPTTSSGPTTKPDRTAFTLTASPTQVGSLQRIDLTGRYKAPNGTVLQVQRREGGQWTDFPVTATVNNGTFATYVQTGHTGANKFRMLDVRTTDASNTVVVMVA
jgi:hypothetical protein